MAWTGAGNRAETGLGPTPGREPGVGPFTSIAASGYSHHKLAITPPGSVSCEDGIAYPGRVSRSRRISTDSYGSPVARSRPISQVRLLERWASKWRPATSLASGRGGGGGPPGGGMARWPGETHEGAVRGT